VERECEGFQNRVIGSIDNSLLDRELFETSDAFERFEVTKDDSRHSFSPVSAVVDLEAHPFSEDELLSDQ
jgi:hypothetical protein